MLVCRNFLYSIGKSAEDHFAGTGKMVEIDKGRSCEADGYSASPFNSLEFEGIKSEAEFNSCLLAAKEWLAEKCMSLFVCKWRL